MGPAPEEVFYPEEALENCIEGWVHLSYEFSSDNMATNIRVLDSDPPGVFEEAAISAFSIWTFSDEQVSSPENTQYVFRYNLEEGVEACLLEKNSNDQEA
ncbi:energy transducer TonB [Gammaproteobacteria bacterium AH-315-E17]|nr:energy transducer TonB [Gammaproteobacteria bacterium AH-315-E17]